MDLTTVLNEAGIPHLIFDNQKTTAMAINSGIISDFIETLFNNKPMAPDELEYRLLVNDIRIDTMLFVFDLCEDNSITIDQAKKYIESSDGGNVAIASLCMMVCHLADRKWTRQQIDRGIGDYVVAGDLMCLLGYI